MGRGAAEETGAGADAAECALSTFMIAVRKMPTWCSELNYESYRLQVSDRERLSAITKIGGRGAGLVNL